MIPIRFEICEDYTCGLWFLFHSLSVNALSSDISGRQFITVLRNWVDHYFLCDTCRSHFLATVDSYLKNEDISMKDVVLFLWQTHNRVNLRVHVEDGNESDKEKVLYPTKLSCLSCWKTESNLGLEDGAIALFEQERVFDYLVFTYQAHGYRIPATVGIRGYDLSPGVLQGLIVFIGIFLVFLFHLIRKKQSIDFKGN